MNDRRRRIFVKILRKSFAGFGLVFPLYLAQD